MGIYPNMTEHGWKKDDGPKFSKKYFDGDDFFIWVAPYG